MFAVVYDVAQKFAPEFKWRPEMHTRILYQFHSLLEAQRQCYYLNVLNEKAERLWNHLSADDKAKLKDSLQDQDMADRILHHYFFADLFPRLGPSEKCYLVVRIPEARGKKVGHGANSDEAAES